jgi:hypothetical protein
MSRSCRIIAAVALCFLAGCDLASAQTPGQPWPALTPEQKRAPCVELITAEEIRSLKRRDVLVQVIEDRAGASTCGWADGPQDTMAGFVVIRHTAEWFKYQDLPGPKESFDVKREGYDAVVGTEPIAGLGLEACITKHEQLPTVLMRRAADVLFVSCSNCSRDQTIAIARLAATP